jgi:hypothetical protein
MASCLICIFLYVEANGINAINHCSPLNPLLPGEGNGEGINKVNPLFSYPSSCPSLGGRREVLFEYQEAAFMSCRS